MGFGAGSQGAAGFNLDADPLGAVDQFYKQYVSRLPAGPEP